PYTYAWSNGQSGPMITGLTIGTYTVTVTDANGCTTSAGFIVEQPFLLEVTIITQGTTCLPSGVTAGASASGGVGPYSYQWNTGAMTNVISNLGAGTYIVQVTDANGCTAMASVVVEEEPDIQIMINSNDVSCFDFNDGAAMAVPQNGEAPFTFSWSNGQTTAIITGLEAGVYTVTVTDANGCSGVASVTIEEPPLLMVNANGQDATCPGVDDGMAQAQVVGGTNPYTYSWSNGMTTALITGLEPGVYTVTVTDANGCTASDQVTISEGPGLQLQITAQDVSCFGFADGAAGAQVTNGTPPYQYEWSNGAFTQTITGLAAGVYTVNVMDATGCTGSAVAIVNEPDPLQASTSTIDASCIGSEDGVAEVTQVIGGTPPYSYNWSDGQSGPIAINLNPGNYTVTISDDNDCEVVEMVQIGIDNDLDVSVQVNNPPCAGSMDGMATATGTGGQAPYTYAWSNGATGNTVMNLGEGIYDVTVTDALGCMAMTLFQIVALDAPSCNAFVENEISVPGGSDGVVNVTVSGGTMPYMYEWSNGATTAQNGGLSEGIYSVTVTDANGCMTTCSVILGEPPSAKVGDKVWNDEDQDGIQDVGEPGVGGVQVILTGTDEDGNAVNLVTTTDGAGMYLFDPIPPGTYKITFTLPNNFEFTLQNVGANDEVDSDVDPTMGMTAFFTLVDGDCDLTQDAGIFQYCINVTDPGEIGYDEYLCGPGNDPAEIIELAPPSGGVGTLEYLWMMSVNPGPIGSGVWEPIPNSNAPTYDPGPIYETTYYVRCVRRDGCILYLEPDPIVKEVGDVAIAEISGPNVVCVDEVVTFTAADAGPNATYSWDFGPNASPQYASTPSVDVTWAGFGYANIALTVVNDGCTAHVFYPISITDNPIFCGNGLIISAQQQNDVIAVDWAVTGFTGSYRFMIEHSDDGHAFQMIGEMEYHQGETDYTYIDEHPHYGSNFYRVRLESDQGAFIESNVVEVVMPVGKETLSVYPNPVKELLYVEWLKLVEGPT
ncbi:MAG: PKD domain-containing protein, partial [Phaeodactylibacter sp.]|nr:PKD domain-containing protein [Phaeodactylibacter sp.]